MNFSHIVETSEHEIQIIIGTEVQFIAEILNEILMQGEIKLKIIKIFNNNSIAALSDELGDIILTGSGIGFQKKIGDLVDESHIEKTYILKIKAKNGYVEELMILNLFTMKLQAYQLIKQQMS